MLMVLQVIYSEVLQSNRQSASNRGPGSQQNGMPGLAPAGPPAPGPLLHNGHEFDCIGPGAYPRGPSGKVWLAAAGVATCHEFRHVPDRVGIVEGTNKLNITDRVAPQRLRSSC